MIGPIISGAGSNGPLPWRQLRLRDSIDADWRQNVTPFRVTSQSQDADGWITLDLENSTPIVDFPPEAAYLRFNFSDSSGFQYPAGPGENQFGWQLNVLLQRDETVWVGSAAQETVYLGVIDHDGELDAVGVKGIMMGIRTTAATAANTLIAGDMTSAQPFAGSTAQRIYSVFLTSGTQTNYCFAGGFDADNVAVSSTNWGSFDTFTGNRKIVLAVGCNSTANDGPHPVRFRVFYLWTQVQNPIPWTAP